MEAVEQRRRALNDQGVELNQLNLDNNQMLLDELQSEVEDPEVLRSRREEMLNMFQTKSLS